MKAGHKFLVSGTILAIVWGALAFGAVYPWAYVPLAGLAVLLGVVEIAAIRRYVPVGVLTIGFSLVIVATALQLVPLSARTLARVSPGAHTFLTNQSFSYRLGQTTASPGDPEAAAIPPAMATISIAPRQTAVGLALLTAFAIFLLGTARLLSVTSARPIVHGVAGFGLILAFIGIVQYALLGTGEREAIKIYGLWEPRFRAMSFGPFVNRNHFAGWMLMALPLAVGGVHAVKDSLHDLPMAGRDWFRWLSTPKAGRLALMTFAVLLMGLSLLLSGSQSAMAGLAAGSIAFGALIFRREQTTRMRFVACGSFLAAGLALAVWAGPTLVARRVTSVATDASTVGGGREAWGDTLNIIRNFSATGTGLNTYGTAMIQYQSRRDLPRFQEAHNEYLQLAAEGGLLLGIPILLTIAVFLRSVWKRFHEAPHSGTTYWLRVGAVIGLVSIAFQSIFEFSLQMPANALLFALLAAIALHRSPNLIRSGSKRFEAAAAAVAAVEDGSDDSDVTIPVRAKLPARRSHVIVPPRP